MDSIDFLPERVKTQRERRRRLAAQAYALAACVAIMVVVAYFRQGQIRSARAALVAVQQQAADVRGQINKLGELERQQAELMVMERIETELGSRVGVLDVLGELQFVMPESITLTSLTLETMEVSTAAAPSRTSRSRRATKAQDVGATTVNRIQAVITGVSPTDVDVANFIGQLSASPLFEDVNMGYARTVEYRGRQAREFQASCYITR